MDIQKQQKTIEWICKRLNIVIRLLNQMCWELGIIVERQIYTIILVIKV